MKVYTILEIDSIPHLYLVFYLFNYIYYTTNLMFCQDFFYGLQFPHGEYPCEIISSLLSDTVCLFFSDIRLTELQVE